MNIYINDLIHLMQNIDAVSGDGIRSLMGEILAAEPMVGWEIGPDPIDWNLMVMALTSGGDVKLLDRIETELNLPIKGERWMITAGRPPKSWERYFEILSDTGKPIPVNGDEWGWKVNEVDKLANINILSPRKFRNQKYQLDCAIEILFSGDIGEANFVRLVHIDNIEFYSKSFKDEYRNMSSFRSEFAQWFPDAPYSNFLKKG